MRLLLDSHAYLWWLLDDSRLSSIACNSIADDSSLVYISAVSIWELQVKAVLGRLELGATDLVGEIEANDFLELPIVARHGQAAAALPRLHDDPFDRMLIAQAQIEGLTLVTRDAAIKRYQVSVLEA